MIRGLSGESGRGLGSRRAPAPAKLLIVDLIAEHDIEAHKEFAGEGDFRLGPAPSMEDREVATPKILVGAGSQRRRLSQYSAEERVALLGDLTEMLFVGRGVDRRGQA